LKRKDLIRHLKTHGCEFLREGANHSIYVKRPAEAVSAVPRHREINEHLARKICKDLEVPDPFTKR
jgi:predicted RNA binding protein YcfA (HicA-like mRNA interferase family)